MRSNVQQMRETTNKLLCRRIHIYLICSLDTACWCCYHHHRWLLTRYDEYSGSIIIIYYYYLEEGIYLLPSHPLPFQDHPDLDISSRSCCIKTSTGSIWSLVTVEHRMSTLKWTQGWWLVTSLHFTELTLTATTCWRMNTYFKLKILHAWMCILRGCVLSPGCWLCMQHHLDGKHNFE